MLNFVPSLLINWVDRPTVYQDRAETVRVYVQEWQFDAYFIIICKSLELTPIQTKNKQNKTKNW